MNKSLLCCLIAFFSLLYPVFSQNSKLEFKYETKSEISKENTVIFTILGNKIDFAKSEKLASVMLKTEGIVSFKIFYNRRCKLILKDEPKYNAKYIRNILLSEDLDFDIDYVNVTDKFIESDLLDKKLLYPYNYHPTPIENYSIPKSFPTLVDTGNPEQDKIILGEAKQKWIEENPDTYKAMTGFEYLDYSQKLKGLK